MNVNQMYELMADVLSKNIQQGYLSPQNFYNWINQAQRSYLDYLLGEYQQYQVSHPVPAVSFGGNERIRDSVAPLIYNIVLPIDGSGISSFPSDYEYVDNMWGVYGFYNIRFIQQDRLDSFVHSDIDPVADNPVYLIRQEGFWFHPDRPYGENQAKMSYVRNPPSIVWGYVEDSNGNPVWNPATSQNPVWSDTDCLQIIVRALALAGVSMQVGAVLQYSQEIKQRGQ